MKYEISEYPLFNWLVQYHCEVNLSACLASLSPAIPPEGAENKLTQGCLIIANGDTLVDRLQQDEIILDHTPPCFESTSSYEQFSRFLSQKSQLDGAFVHDGRNKKMARVSKIANSSSKLNKARKEQAELIPRDFVHSEREEGLTDEYIDEYVGTKTDLAMCLPVAYSSQKSIIQAFQIKTSSYGALGLGKVTHFGPQGLAEEFFFDGRENSVVGVYRTYQKVKDDLVKTGEKEVFICPFQSKESAPGKNEYAFSPP